MYNSTPSNPINVSQLSKDLINVFQFLEDFSALMSNANHLNYIFEDLINFFGLFDLKEDHIFVFENFLLCKIKKDLTILM